MYSTFFLLIDYPISRKLIATGPDQHMASRDINSQEMELSIAEQLFEADRHKICECALSELMIAQEVPEHVLSMIWETWLALLQRTSNFSSYRLGTINYEQSTSNIWRCICTAVSRAIAQNSIDPQLIKGIGFDATCSLAALHSRRKLTCFCNWPKVQPVCDQNVMLWLNHRPVKRLNISMTLTTAFSVTLEGTIST